MRVTTSGARAMLAAAPAEGTVVSFGETDLFAALAYLCREAGRGLRYYMPDSLPIPAGTDSGVELRAVPSSDIRELRRAASESLAPGEVLLDEFRDESVVREYITTVGPAMLSACYGSLTDFVCPIGSGAAFTGLGKVFSALKDDIGLIAVEPLESPTLSTGRAGERAVEGMGYGIFPPLYDASMATEVIAVSEEARGKCLSELNDLISPELGPTSAAAVEAALRVLRMKNSDRTRVLVVLDS